MAAALFFLGLVLGANLGLVIGGALCAAKRADERSGA